MGIISTIGAGIGVLQSGYNLIKDFGNVDNERAVAANKELAEFNAEKSREMMDAQQLYQLEQMERAQGYNVENQMRAQGYNVSNMKLGQQYLQDNMRLNHEYNMDSMEKQFIYNNMLSSAGRQILQQRLAGINPSGGQGSGSVTALANSGSAPSVPSSPAPSSSPLGVAPGNFGGSIPASLRYSGSDAAAIGASYQSSRLAEKEGALTDAKTESQRIYNVTQLNSQIMDLFDKRASIAEKFSRVGHYDALAKSTLLKLDDEIRVLQAQRDNLIKMGEAAIRNAKAREKEVDTQAKVQSEQARHNLNIEASYRIMANAAKLSSEASKTTSEAAQMDAETRRKLFMIQDAKLPMELGKLEAEIVKLTSEYETIEQMRPVLIKQAEASVTQMYADAGLKNAQKYHEYEKMVTDMVDEAIRVVSASAPGIKIKGFK